MIRDMHITIRQDGNQWCALVGPNLQEGVAGFADSIKNALTELVLTLTSDEINRFTERHEEPRCTTYPDSPESCYEGPCDGSCQDSRDSDG